MGTVATDRIAASPSEPPAAAKAPDADVAARVAARRTARLGRRSDQDCSRQPLGAFLDKRQVEAVWKTFYGAAADNSFYIWQWISMGLMSERNEATSRTPEQAALSAG